MLVAVLHWRNLCIQILFTAYRPCTAIPRYFSLHLLLCQQQDDLLHSFSKKTDTRAKVCLLFISSVFQAAIPSCDWETFAVEGPHENGTWWSVLKAQNGEHIRNVLRQLRQKRTYRAWTLFYCVILFRMVLSLEHFCSFMFCDETVCETLRSCKYSYGQLTWSDRVKRQNKQNKAEEAVYIQ